MKEQNPNRIGAAWLNSYKEPREDTPTIKVEDAEGNEVVSGHYLSVSFEIDGKAYKANLYLNTYKSEEKHPDFNLLLRDDTKTPKAPVKKFGGPKKKTGFYGKGGKK